MLTTILGFIIVLGILVFFHELGHYWVARRNGIVVEEFGMGYPPRLVKLFTYDGTDFTLNLLPFGGFARMKGEDAGDMSPGSFNAASRGARAATLLAGPLMNGLLAIVLFAASFMAGFPAPAAYPLLGDVAPTSTAARYGLQTGDLVLDVDGRPALVRGLDDMNYRVMQRNNAGTPSTGTIVVSRDGEVMTLPFDGAVSVSDLLDGTSFLQVLTTEILATAENSPAALAGMQAGDLVYAVDDTVISYENTLNDVIQAKAGTEVSMQLLRDNAWVTVNITPRVDPPPGEGSLGVQIGPNTTLATLPIFSALWRGVLSTGEYILLVLQLPFALLMGTLSPADAQLSGPVGIAQMVGGAIDATRDTGLWFPILRLSAVLSAALAITNLLPLPALDGGRLLFILIETLRGRRINPEREGLVHMVGFVLLLGLLAIVTVQDLRSTQQGIDWLSLLGQ